MSTAVSNDRLKAYEVYVRTDSALVESLFRIILLVMLGLCLAAGLFFKTVKPAVVAVEQEIRRIRATFDLRQSPPPPPVAPRPVVKQPPVDLTTAPVLNQTENDIPKPSAQPPAARRVYGVRKVYSTGLGSSGALSDAVVGKLGNTLNKEFDTLSATRSDLLGTIVPVTTITTAPRFKKQVKPEYTQEMLENGIEGVVKVRVLVDIDGLVKDAKAVSDLGYGTAQRAVEACLKMEFEPARDPEGPKAVWILVSIRFVKLG